MDNDIAALPDDIDALKAALTVARAKMREVTAEREAGAAELAVARAKASEDLALIAHQKLRIARLEVTGASPTRPSALTVRLAHPFWHPELPDRGHDQRDVLVRRSEKLFGFGSLARWSEHRTA